MLPSEQPDRIHVAFDDHRLVANAGLLLAVTLAQHLGLGELGVLAHGVCPSESRRLRWDEAHEGEAAEGET